MEVISLLESILSKKAEKRKIDGTHEETWAKLLKYCQDLDSTVSTRDGNRFKRSEQTLLLGSVRCFKVKARFGSMLDVLNRAPARFESSILTVLLGSIKLGPSCSIRLDIA